MHRGLIVMILVVGSFIKITLLHTNLFGRTSKEKIRSVTSGLIETKNFLSAFTANKSLLDTIKTASNVSFLKGYSCNLNSQWGKKTNLLFF